MKVAFIHDWLVSLAGSEQVLLKMHELFPKAPIYTSVYCEKNFPSLKNVKVITSFLQKVPFAKSKHQMFPHLRPVAFEQFDLSKYDIVISDGHAEAKGVITKPETLHICYCHTPIRYYWSDYHEYIKNLRYGILNPLIKLGMPYLINYLRLWDIAAADRVDYFIANSQYVANRIKKYYRRDATVIYPPVDTAKFKPAGKVKNYYFAAGRLIPYKKFDLIIEAFNDLGLPLKIAGTGSEFKKLKEMAKKNVELLGYVSDEELTRLYAEAKAFIFPQEEDFGIAPVEAMASGRPVIAYAKGGALETVKEGVTGIFFKEQTPQCLIDAVRKFDPQVFQPTKIRQHALNFDIKVFQKKIKQFIAEKYQKHQEEMNLNND
jgi:glycosyltransferase involved in cell wall biosynthesis